MIYEEVPRDIFNKQQKEVLKTNFHSVTAYQIYFPPRVENLDPISGYPFPCYHKNTSVLFTK